MMLVELDPRIGVIEAKLGITCPVTLIRKEEFENWNEILDTEIDLDSVIPWELGIWSRRKRGSDWWFQWRIHDYECGGH